MRLSYNLKKGRLDVSENFIKLTTFIKREYRYAKSN